MRARPSHSLALCALAALLCIAAAASAGDQPLTRDVSLADVTAPIVHEAAPTADNSPVDLEAIDEATSSSTEPIALETQATTSVGVLAGAAADISRESLRERSSSIEALRRVSDSFLSASLAKQQQEHEQDDIRRQLEEEDRDWNDLESQPSLLELEEQDADSDSTALYISTPKSPKRVVRRVVRRVVKRVPKQNSQMRFREELAAADSAFAQNQDAAAAHAGSGHKHKVIRVIKRIIRVPRKAKAEQRVAPHHEVLMKLDTAEHQPTPILPRFAEVRQKAATHAKAKTKAKAHAKAEVEAEAEAEAETEAEAQVETGVTARQRIHANGQLFTEEKHTRRADPLPRFAEVEKKKGGKGKKGAKGKGPKKSESQAIEDCTGCKFVWSQVEMDIGNARYVEDVQASFEHNCMDAQKSTLFYGVCEDMYDDMYAMTDDYMSNRYSVKKICQRAKMCTK